MKRLLPLLLTLFLLGSAHLRAQLEGFGNMPIDIRGEHTKYENGIAIADQNVFIRYGESTVYCDYAQYNTDTHDVLLLGNVRIYKNGRLFTGERAVYNLETKKITASDFRADVYPFDVQAESLTSMGPNAYRVRDGIFTTSDNSKPDYHVSAKGARIYPGDRIILENVTAYIGQTPIFWFPAIYQSLNKNQGFLIVPGYTGVFGVYLRSRYTFPITQDLGATFQLDVFSKRGVGLGLDSRWGGGDTKDEREWGRFRSYFIHDLEPGFNDTSLARENIDPNRYRVSLQDRTYLTEDIYSSININKLSDARFLQDFYPAEFRSDRNPDNLIYLTKWNEDYDITLMTKKSLNKFFDFTERLPEGDFDSKTRPIFGDSGLFYVGQTGAGYLRRDFATGAPFPDYQTFRFDTFHQLEYPKTLFGWLAVNPKAGFRETYYENTGQFENFVTTSSTTQSDGSVIPSNTDEVGLVKHGSTLRTVLNASVEASFKLSKAYEQVQSRAWGLDGLRHIIQPYMDLSYVWTSRPADNLLQFDRVNPSTQRLPLDFPEFNEIDAITNWTVLRLGVNNRFQTRRDNQTLNWLEISTFFDINIQRPKFEDAFLSIPQTSANVTNMSPVRGVVADPGTFSNVYNRITFQPYNWLKANIDSQVPLLDAGFTEVNSALNFMLNQDTSVQIGHEYIQGNPLFPNSSYFIFGAYRRITDNWGLSFREAYQFDGSYLAQQRYAIHRDLSSWVASLALEVINDGAGKTTYGVALTFTIKDLPQINVPVSFDPEGLVGSSKGSGN